MQPGKNKNLKQQYPSITENLSFSDFQSGTIHKSHLEDYFQVSLLDYSAHASTFKKTNIILLNMFYSSRYSIEEDIHVFIKDHIEYVAVI